MAGLAVLGLSKHMGTGAAPAARMQPTVPCRGSACEAASSAARSPSSPSCDFHYFILQVYVLECLLRGTCLSLPRSHSPTISASLFSYCLPHSPPSPLPAPGHRLQSAPTRVPCPCFHRALHQMGLLFPLPFSRQIVSPLWPCGSTVEGWKQHTVSAWGQARSCSQQKQVELGAIGKPFCWCRWVGGSVPALLSPWAAPQPGPEPGHLLDMHPQLRRQLQPLPGWIWLLFALIQLPHRKAWPSWNILSLWY